MPARLSLDEFVNNLRDSGLFTTDELQNTLSSLPRIGTADADTLREHLVSTAKLTPFQVSAVNERLFDHLLIGNYQVLDRLGAGGMGTVYKARHRRMKRIVAIKVLAREVGQSATFVQRFQREVEAAARLSHPNVVMAFDADEADVGHFLVMEFVDGRDLASAVQEQGPLPAAEAVHCVVQAARALEYAHAQGIIHRDIKPANLLRDVRGVVKVADLGLARFNDALTKSPEEAEFVTQAGTIMGTVDFMPPEQALSLTDIDHRADVYSLGCTLFFLLTGRPPYQGQSLMATLLLHREGPVPSLRDVRPDLPASLDAVFQRMVAKNPGDRFSSMSEVIGALERVDGQSLPASTPRLQPVPPPVQTSATIDIPMHGASPAPAAGGQTVDLTAPGGIDATGTTVLLVEPSRTQAVIIRGYFQKLGIERVTTAGSGQAALEAAQMQLPSVIVCAMQLADMTGVQLAQKIRADSALSSTGFVLITSQSDAREAELSNPVDRIVRMHKPFSLEQLAQAVTAAQVPPKNVRGATSSDTIGRLRVLLVDDSAAARAHIRGVLSGLGLKSITEAVDGADAVTCLQRDQFDLIVTDFTMPRLDGRGLVEFIRHRSATPHVPVIMVTTETDPAKLDPVRRLGVSAISDKSCPPDIVRGVLERLR